jgi:hypothetical protein
MADERRRDANAAQVRGDIQAGLTGEKQPGFDPAMAPLETDAEAGGFPLSPAQIREARHGQLEGKRPQISGDDGSAMRPVFSGNRTTPQGRIWLVLFAVVLVAGIAAGLLAAIHTVSGS